MQRNFEFGITWTTCGSDLRDHWLKIYFGWKKLTFSIQDFRILVFHFIVDHENVFLQIFLLKINYFREI